MKGYFKIDGKIYSGYDVEIKATSYIQERFLGYSIVCNEEFIDDVNNGKAIFDNVNVCDGAKVHIIRGCPIPNDDIRKNYKIKRDVDSGDFNVFPEFKPLYTFFDTVYVSDSLKKVILFHRSGILSHVISQNYNIKKTFVPVCPVYNTEWVKLFNGEYTKPCVSYKKLSINYSNKLTPDTLFLLYRLGTQPQSRENIEKFKLQLQAINQTNWRDYPNSVRKIIEYASFYINCSNFVSRHKSERNKVTEQFFNIESIDYTDEDFNMLGDTMELILDINGTKYVSFIELRYKLAEKGISEKDVETFFGGIVQLKRRERKDA